MMRRAASESIRCYQPLSEKSNFNYEKLKTVLLLEIVHMNFRDAELARSTGQTVVGLPQRVAQQEAFERAFRLLPARQLIAIKNQPIVVGEDDLFFVLR